MGRRKVAAWEWFVYGVGVGFWLDEARDRIEAWHRRTWKPTAVVSPIALTSDEERQMLEHLEDLEAAATDVEFAHPHSASVLRNAASFYRRPYVVKDDVAAVG